MSRRRSSRLEGTAAGVSSTSVASTSGGVPLAVAAVAPAPVPRPPTTLSSLPVELKLAISNMVRQADAGAEARRLQREEDGADSDGDYDGLGGPGKRIRTTAWGKGVRQLSMVSREWNALCMRMRVETISSKQLRDTMGHQRVLVQFGRHTRKIKLSPKHRTLPWGFHNEPEEVRDAFEIENFRSAVGKLSTLQSSLPNVHALDLDTEFIKAVWTILCLSNNAHGTSLEDEQYLTAFKYLCRTIREIKLDVDPIFVGYHLSTILPLIGLLDTVHFTGNPFINHRSNSSRLFRDLKKIAHLSWTIQPTDELMAPAWVELAKEVDLRLKTLAVALWDNSEDVDDGEGEYLEVSQTLVDFIATFAPTLESLTIKAPNGAADDIKFGTPYPLLRTLTLSCPNHMATPFLSSINAPLSTLDLSKSPGVAITKPLLQPFEATLKHVVGVKATPSAVSWMRERGILFVQIEMEKYEEMGFGEECREELTRKAKDTLERAMRLLERHEEFGDKGGAGMLLRSLAGVKEYIRMDAE